MFENLITSYIFRNNYKVRYQAREFLKVLKNLTEFDLAHIYRNSIEKSIIKPRIVRGLGETGNHSDIEKIIQFVECERVKLNAQQYTHFTS